MQQYKYKHMSCLSTSDVYDVQSIQLTTNMSIQPRRKLFCVSSANLLNETRVTNVKPKWLPMRFNRRSQCSEAPNVVLYLDSLFCFGTKTKPVKHITSRNQEELIFLLFRICFCCDSQSTSDFDRFLWRT